MKILDNIRRNAARKSDLDADKQLLNAAAEEIELMNAALRAIMSCYVVRFEGMVVGLRAGVDLAQPYHIAKQATNTAEHP